MDRSLYERLGGKDAEGAPSEVCARVAYPPPPVHEPEPERVASQESSQSCEAKADAGRGGRQHQSQDDRLGEKAPPPVLGGDQHEPPGGGRSGRDLHLRVLSPAKPQG